MDNTIVTIPLGLALWILGVLLTVIGAIVGVVYANLRKRSEDMEKELDTYKSCTDKRIEMLLLDYTKINERVISKEELTAAINEAVKKQFFEFENKLFKEGILKP